MFQFFTPRFFIYFSKLLIPWLAIIWLSSTAIGLYYALFYSPPDYQQGEMVRIMYVHVPAAWMSLAIYSFIAICSFVSLVWRAKLAYIIAIAAAPIGAAFAFITLITGSIWGKPIWGTWWVWDARLTSMLILFIFYLVYLAVIKSGDNIERAEKPAAVIALIGMINVPIVKFSVDIWYSLHQPASVFKLTGPTIHISMLIPLMVMFANYIIFFILLLLIRASTLLESIKIKVKSDLRSN